MIKNNKINNGNNGNWLQTITNLYHYSGLLIDLFFIVVNTPRCKQLENNC